jgi:serine/threonine protein kinase
MNDPVLQIVSSWPSDQPFDAKRAINDWTGRALTANEVANLAIAEFVDRDELGGTTDIAAFAKGFPICEEELLHKIGRIRGASTGRYPRLNSTFLNHTIIRYLSLAPQTQVYLAIDPDLGGRVCVLKVTQSGSREHLMLARLSHPNVVTLYSARTSGEQALPVISLEYCGESTKIQEATRAEITTRINDVAKAVEYMHENGIVHNDLAFRNVIFNNKETKIIDFNASVLLSELGSVRPIGTLAYLSNTSVTELLRFNRFITPVEHSIDYFAFAVLCYRMITGSIPWDENASAETEHLQELLERREKLTESQLDRSRLTKAERLLFLEVFRGRRLFPPVLFARLLRAAKRKHVARVVQYVGVFLLLTGVLIWGVTTTLPSVKYSKANSIAPSLLDDVRPELGAALSDGRLAEVYAICYRNRNSLNIKERALFAYAIGMCHPDPVAEVKVGLSVISSGKADAAVFSNVACASLFRGNLDEAFEALDVARALDPSLEQALVLRAIAMDMNRDAKIADVLEAVAVVVKMHPEQASIRKLAINSLARYEASGDLSERSLKYSVEIHDMLRSTEHIRSEATFQFYALPYPASFGKSIQSNASDK